MKSINKSLNIGFIGQGFVGKNYANDFEKRGYKVIRYSQDKEYIDNKDKIKKCDIVFIAVPTPTNKNGFDISIVKSTLKLIGKGKIAIIKSTVLPGTTSQLQKEFDSIIILHSPEFLSEKTAEYDSAHPSRNIIGISKDTKKHIKSAELIMSILPDSPYKLICSSDESEIIKYGKNCLGYIRILFTNMIYDLTKSYNADWDKVKDAMIADPDNSPTYMNPIHKSGRGAGGRCFIKDFAAFREIYEKRLSNDKAGIELLKSLENKNIDLLKSTNKDLDILLQVYNI